MSDHMQVYAPMPAAQRARIRRVVISATIGTVIEWYDFTLYGAAAGLVVNRLFFPQLSAVNGTLAAFAAFAAGFLMRPFGGIIIAHFGDRFGRKPALIFTIVLMGFSTACMGCLPTYAQIGIAAPVLLVILRLLQGFGAGAEYAGAVVVVAEYVPERQKGLLTGMLRSAALMGGLLATLSFLAASYTSEEILLGWAWRLPFLASAVLFFVALYLRKHLDETPEYVAAIENATARQKEVKIPLGELIRDRPRELFFGFLSVTGDGATIYILSTYLLSYMVSSLGMDRPSALLAVMVSMGAGIVMTPFMGGISDRIGYARVFLFGAVFMLLYAFPLFALLDMKIRSVTILAMSIGYVFGVAPLGAQGAFLASLFETRYRFSGIAITREINGMLVSGPTPFIAATLLVLGEGSPKFVVAYLMVCCALTIVAILAVKRRAIHTSAVKMDG